MEKLDGCLLRASSAVDDAKCFAAVKAFFKRTSMVHTYWKTRVETSGGAASTKNRLEQTNEAEAKWILEGSLQGLEKMYADRFDATGNEETSCAGTAGTVYGDAACKTIIEAWVTANS